MAKVVRRAVIVDLRYTSTEDLNHSSFHLERLKGQVADLTQTDSFFTDNCGDVAVHVYALTNSRSDNDEDGVCTSRNRHDDVSSSQCEVSKNLNDAILNTAGKTLTTLEIVRSEETVAGFYRVKVMLDDVDISVIKVLCPADRVSFWTVVCQLLLTPVYEWTVQPVVTWGNDAAVPLIEGGETPLDRDGKCRLGYRELNMLCIFIFKAGSQVIMRFHRTLQ
jgi:hypothetical protein